MLLSPPRVQQHHHAAIPAVPSLASSSSYHQMNIVETTIHDAGFYLFTTDSTCFDGAAFYRCNSRNRLLWGIGINFLQMTATNIKEMMSTTIGILITLLLVNTGTKTKL